MENNNWGNDTNNPGNQPNENQQNNNQSYGNQPYNNPQYGNQQYNGQPYNNQQYNGQPYNGQQYNMQPYNNQPYYNQPYYNQPNNGMPFYGPEQERQANKLCWISLACALGSKLVPVLWGIISLIRDKAEIFQGQFYNYIGTYFYGIIGFACEILGVAALVLMIHVRVKYPKNTFGKVLMWLYIIYLVLMAIAVIALIVACYQCAQTCRGF